jgi:HEPN pEK499 p136
MAQTKTAELGPRNDPLGLVQRALINLDIIEESFQSNGRGHVVTQLVQSMLALIVFPKEKALLNMCKHERLSELRKDQKWPTLVPELDEYERKTLSLYEVLWHMRNAVCHGRVIFIGKGKASPDSRFFEDVIIQFSDENKHGQKWRLTMDATDVRKFCLLIADVIYH